MEEKKCFKCGEVKSLTDFYKHPQMPDGRVNKCKECNKKDVRENRLIKVEYYRNYDKDRGNRQSNKYRQEYLQKYPNKYKAHTIVSNAIRDKKLFKKPCEICGSNKSIHAHHDDYLEPLNIRWLCAAHHSQWHKANGEADNAQ
jgi:hypothetical protein